MKEKVKKLVDDNIKDLGLFVSDVYYSTDDGITTSFSFVQSANK